MSPARRAARRARWVGPLWRWHRRAGLLAALLLLFLAVSGLLLNHSQGLGLDSRRVQSGWLRALYAEDAGALHAFDAGGRWIAQLADGELLLDGTGVGTCAGALVGARAWQDMLVAACAHELVLLAPDGARIDALGSAGGLDATLQALGAEPERLAVQADGRWRLFDAEAMGLGAELPDGRAVTPGAPPPGLAERLRTEGSWLSWERLLLDLHSGRLFGRFGILVMDLAGVLAILLSLSGVLIWGLRRRQPRKESRHA